MEVSSTTPDHFRGSIRELTNAKKRKKELSAIFHPRWRDPGSVFYADNNKSKSKKKHKKNDKEDKEIEEIEKLLETNDKADFTVIEQSSENSGTKSKRKKNNTIIISPSNSKEIEEKKLMNDLHSNKKKKKIVSWETISNELEKDSSNRIDIDIDNMNTNKKEFMNRLKEFNDKNKNLHDLEEEVPVYNLEEWTLMYSDEINKNSDRIEAEIKESMLQEIDEKSEIGNDAPQNEKKRKYKKPVSKSKKDEKENEEKGKKGLSEDEKEIAILKELFFTKQDGEFTIDIEFGKKVMEYRMLQELLNNEKLMQAYKEKHHGIIINKGSLKPVPLPKLTRSYVQKYLTECKGFEYGQRPCAKRDGCVARIISNYYPQNSESSPQKNAFTLREFLLPEEEKKWEVSGYKVLPQENKLCILDNWMLTSVKYYNNKFSKRPSFEIIQDHSVVIDQKDGYNLEYCLEPCVNGMTKNNSPKPSLKENDFYGIIEPIIKFVNTLWTVSKRKVMLTRRGGIPEEVAVRCMEELPAMGANF